MTWFANLSVRSKMLMPLSIAGAVMVGLIVLGASAVGSAAGSAQHLYANGARPLDALGHIRDAEGDSRVAVHAYVGAASIAERAAVAKDVSTADGALDAAVAAYRADKGSTLTPQRAAMLSTFTGAVTQWRQFRDTRVFPVAGHPVAVQALIAGPLADIDTRFAAVMDAIDTAEGADAARLAADAAQAAATARLTLLALGAAGVLLALGIGAVAVRAVTRPLAQVGHALAAMADGDLTVAVDVSSNDEVGRMAQAFNRAQAATAETVTALTTSARALTESAVQIADIGHQIGSSADEANALATAAAQAAVQVSHDVQTVAAGAEQMGASISEISRNSSEASRVAGNAVAAAEVTNQMMDRLGAASASIASVTSTISTVAAQTNLLALNATIEAARAGEAGRGFAVVASEVKQLAHETAKATEDISQRVAGISAETAAAITAIAEISAVIAQINDYQGTIAAAVEEQSATTDEMNRGVAEAAGRTSHIAENISQVAATTAATRATVGHAEQAAATLQALAADLSGLVNRFTVVGG